jgi:hypothetical protein
MQSSKALADQIHQITYGLEGQQVFLLPGGHSEAKNAATEQICLWIGCSVRSFLKLNGQRCSLADFFNQ